MNVTLSSFVGLPYIRGGRDAGQGLDCWGFVLHAYKEFLGIDLPPLPGFDTHNAALVARKIATEQINGDEWTRETEPAPFLLVAMARNRFFHHVGVFDTDANQIVHAIPVHGIVAHSLTSLRVRGFRRIEFYRFKYHGNNC